MFLFGSSAAEAAPNFLPDDATQGWLADALAAVARVLGPVAQEPRWLAEPPRGVAPPGDLDGLFDFICGVQAQIGQGDLEFTLAETADGRPGVPAGFAAIGDPRGHLLHAFARGEELALVVSPRIFKVRPLLLASVARELGRLGLHRAGGGEALARFNGEASAELAGIALGMGPWVANGAYIFENACCGGGCGVNLREVRAGLSLPEASFAVALDARRKGLSRWTATRGLEATQKAAVKASWATSERSLPALAAGTSAPALGR